MTGPPRPEPSQMERAASALRRGSLREALIEYDVALGSSLAGQASTDRGTALLGRALVNQLLGQRSGALGGVVDALDEWRSAPPDWLARALIDIASALEAASPDIAEEYWRVAAQLALRAEDPRLPALIAGQRGMREVTAGAAAAARAHFLEAEALARAAGDDGSSARALVNVARIDLDAGRRREAAHAIGEALALARTGPHVDAAVGVLLDLAALSFLDRGSAEAALYLEQVVALGDAADAFARERALIALTGITRDRGDLAGALSLARQAVALLRARGDVTAVVQAMHDIGVIALQAGDDSAEDQLIESLVGARRHRLPALAASLSRALALLASRRGNHLRALGYAEQAADFAAGSADREACASTLARVAAEAERWQRLDIAVPAHEGAAEIYRGLGRHDAAALHSTAVDNARIALAAESDRDRSVAAGLQIARRITGDP